MAINGKNGNSDRFYFLGFQNHCSHEIKRRLLLGKKGMPNLDNVLKSRHITLWTEVRIVIGMVFPVVMYGCESLTTKKAEPLRIDAFALWWRRLLRDPWTSRRSYQSINPKGNQPRMFFGRTDAEAEAPILCQPDVKSRLMRKDHDAGKD